ncbi:hypothetical protein HYPSUDRAFT_174886 [Hypholoma sublateritium FD-334 SS-4]|uniref:Uncharacterized protein n=1 Tax=Hypholoma sublateritium (strain FD-334 SS-4) TaxID=945553 RepID=A0A0D2QE81_HYPSF|nr:hypothetical protein HYPSUDRAFT_174886 [Hypholoma sublateritium FD-334 SS-4]
MPDAPNNDKTNTRIAAGHTFFDMNTFMTSEGKELAIKTLEKAQDRCPDFFDMYIYNDFWSYGVFDLVDKMLSSLNTKIKKKDLQGAFVVLEALMLFVECEGIWTQCNDGQRVRATNKAIGAAALAVFQGLEKSADFSTAAFPSLESLLQFCCKSCKEGMVCDQEYGPIFRGIARRLFAGKTNADMIRDREMQEEWVASLSDDEDNDNDEDDDDEDEDEDNEDIIPRKKKDMQLKLQKRADDQAAAVPNELRFARVWKDYKEYLAGCPTLPLRGPPKWDLTTWTAAEKKPFQFGDGSDFN